MTVLMYAGACRFQKKDQRWGAASSRASRVHYASGFFTFAGASALGLLSYTLYVTSMALSQYRTTIIIQVEDLRLLRIEQILICYLSYSGA
jgi:hypothetical protein